MVTTETDMPRPRSNDSLLTPAELELMNILWRTQGGTVREVLAALPESRQRAYTSVSTIVRILEQKGFVRAEKSGRSHRYVPVIAQSAYQSHNLSAVVGGLFGGDPLSLVRRLLRSSELSQEDLQQMRHLVEEELGR